MKSLNLKRLIPRALTYFRRGYSQYLQLPFSIIGYATTVYYLAIENIPILKSIFPRFHTFIIYGAIGLLTTGVLIGYWHMKHGPFFKAARDVEVEADPYSSWKLSPVMKALFITVSELAKKEGIDTTEIDKLIEASR